MGEKSKYILGQGSEIKSASRISRNEIQEQLQAQQKEAEEERRKRESVDSKLMEVKNQLEEERKNQEVMEVRLVHDQKLLKESMMALVSHLQNPKNGFPASIFNIITTSTSSNETSSASLMNNNWEDLHGKQNQELQMQKELDNLKDILTFEKQNLEMAIYDCDKFSSLCNEKDVELKAALSEKQRLEMRLPKLSSQGSKKTIPKELVDANNQVFEKIHEELKDRSMLSLRVVNLSHTGIRALPSSINSLCQLQSLILQNCNELKELPDIGNLFLPIGMNKLTNLRSTSFDEILFASDLESSMPPRS
ncbi:hypothetical protein KY289_013365 [Solanum tuberosum]|nr:hypothetical protein KY289_013365 [Solanum tuberosum]